MKTDNTLYKHSYKLLIQLAPDLNFLQPGDALKSGSKCSMDLNLDLLEKQAENSVIALSHYYQHASGDRIPDPDMIIRVNHQAAIAEALTYQDSTVYQQVYGDENRFNPKLKMSLNSFLKQWLKNCLMQGHQLKRIEKRK